MTRPAFYIATGYAVALLAQFGQLYCWHGTLAALWADFFAGGAQPGGTSVAFRLRPEMGAWARLEHTAHWSALYYREAVENAHGAWTDWPFWLLLAGSALAVRTSWRSLTAAVLVAASFPFVYDAALPGTLEPHRHLLGRLVPVTLLLAVAAAAVRRER